MRIAIAALMLIAFLGAGLTLFISTSSGQRLITDRIARAVGGSNAVGVKEIGGDWPSQIIWSGITVADRAGVWLTLDRVEARLKPGALLLGRVDIESAVIGTAHMLRRPVPDPNAPPSPPPTVDGLAATLSRITVRDFRAGVVLLDAAVAGRVIDATVVGSLAEDRESRLHTLALEGRLRTEPGSLAVKLAAGADAALLHVNGAAERFRAVGAVTINNRTAALSGALKLDCRGEPACYAGPDLRLGAVAAEVALAGTLDAPRGTFSFSIDDLAAGTRRLPSLRGAMTASPRGAGGVTIAATGAADGFRDAFPEGRPLIADEANWSFTLVRAPGGVLTLDSARIDSGDAAIHVADLGLSPKLSAGVLRLSLTGAGRMIGRDDSSSRTEASLRIDRLAGGTGTGHLALTTTGLPPAALLPPLLNGSLTLAADVVLGADRLNLTNIAAASGGTSLRGSSTWLRAPRLEHASSSLTLTLAPWGSVLPEATQADVTLTGALAALKANISATLPAVLLSRAPVHDAVIAVDIARTPAGFNARLEGNGQWIDGPLSFAATASQSIPSLIEITGLSWQSPTVDLAGGLTLEAGTGLLTGVLRGPISDLGPLTAAFGAGSAGAADLTARFSAQRGQRLELALAARDVKNAALDAGKLTFTGRFDDLWGELTLSTRAETEDARLFDRPLAGLVTRADGSLGALKVSVDAKGAADTPFSISAATDIAFGDATTFTFQRLALRDGNLSAELLNPARASFSAEALSLASTRIALYGGELSGSFAWNRLTGQFTGALAASDVALPTFADLPGHSASIVVSGEANLAGPVTAVGGSLRVAGALPASKDQPAIAVNAAISLAGGRAKIEATATGLSPEPARLSADIPARLNLASARFALSTSEPVTGSLSWNGALAPLWRFVPADVNVLAGEVAIDATLSGTLDAPVIAGSVNLTRGTYENLVGGTALRNIDANVTGDGQGGFALTIRAQDMNDGSVTLSGRIAGDDEMTADLTAELARLDVLHRDDVIAALSGQVTYTGPVAAGVLRGNVRMVRSLVRLGGSYMPEIPLLRALPGFEPVSNDGLLAGVGLEIAVTTADPIRIEGQGLDSVWRGDLSIAGTMARPDVRGALTLDRGSFSFLGQSFALDTGTVTFTGGGSIDPQLYIAATREASDVTATVTIAGRARAPEVQLSSRPALPRDEILARLLFRKGTGELGPIESIQLASAASDLAGLSQGGINGVLRRTLGVDVTSGAEGDSVMVGRQFGRNLYVSVGQSLTEQEREIVVEWRFSRSLSVKSTTSDVTGADIGVFWRKDY